MKGLATAFLVNWLLIFAAVALLSGCSADLAQQALVTTKTYEAAARTTTAVVKSGLVPDCAKPKIALADNMAYGYVKELNEDAQAWLVADGEEQSVLEEAFTHVKGLATAAIANLAASPKESC
jgi:hypothetical protein